MESTWREKVNAVATSWPIPLGTGAGMALLALILTDSRLATALLFITVFCFLIVIPVNKITGWKMHVWFWATVLIAIIGIVGINWKYYPASDRVFLLERNGGDWGLSYDSFIRLDGVTLKNKLSKGSLRFTPAIENTLPDSRLSGLTLFLTFPESVKFKNDIDPAGLKSYWRFSRIRERGYNTVFAKIGGEIQDGYIGGVSETLELIFPKPDIYNIGYSFEGDLEKEKISSIKKDGAFSIEILE